MARDPTVLKEELTKKQDELIQIQSNLERYEKEVKEHPELADCVASDKVLPLKPPKPQGFVSVGPHTPLQFDRSLTDDEVDREAKNLLREYGEDFMDKTNWDKVPFFDDDKIKIQNRCKEQLMGK